jgi:hypothetical protein
VTAGLEGPSRAKGISGESVGPAVYFPRESALFKIVETHHERFEEVYEEVCSLP